MFYNPQMDRVTTVLGALQGIGIAGVSLASFDASSVSLWVGLVVALLQAANGYFTNK